MNRQGFCSYCGASIASDSRFCGGCGQPLDHGAYQSGDSWAPPQAAQEYDEPVHQDALSGMTTRTGGFLVTQVLPGLIGWIPILGTIASVGLLIWNLFLFKRGQDIGARLLGMRVVRDTGELAGFFHMWTRNLASVISLIVLGAGYWTAYFAPHRQTWHDKMLGTYVVEDAEEMASRLSTSSSAAVTWFWVSLIAIVVVVIVVLALAAFGFAVE